MPVGDALVVGQAGCLVAVQVIDALFEASDKLYLEAIDETKQVAAAKYGEDVATVTGDCMVIGKDVLDIYEIAGKGVTKTLAKKAASHTAKGLALGVKEGIAA